MVLSQYCSSKNKNTLDCFFKFRVSPERMNDKLENMHLRNICKLWHNQNHVSSTLKNCVFHTYEYENRVCLHLAIHIIIGDRVKGRVS